MRDGLLMQAGLGILRMGSMELCGAPALMWGSRAYAYPGENLNSGNRCGHDPQKLAVDRLNLHAPAGGNWPRLIKAAIKGIQAYFDNAEALEQLTHLPKKCKRTKAYRVKRNKDGTLRQNRSEAREGFALVSSVMFTYTDLKSQRIGHYTASGVFVHTSFLDIARRCSMTCQVKARDDEGKVIPGQLKEVPTSRFWSVIRDLKRAGALKVWEQYEEQDDHKRALSAVKQFSKEFLATVAGWSMVKVEKACRSASQRVGGFLLKAVESGVENIHQRKALIKGIQKANVKAALFGDGGTTAKNRQPVIGGARESVEAALRQEYVEHEAQVLRSITEALGRPPRGAEQFRMQSQHGFMSYDEFVRRRLPG